MSAPAGSSAHAEPTRSIPIAGEPELDDFFENGALALHIVDGRGVILRANRAELTMLGYEAHEYIGQPVQRYHADKATIEDILARLLRGETVRNHPARLLTRSGEIRHVLIDSSGRFRNGTFEHTRCFTRDVTEQRLAEARLREQTERYEALVRAQSELGDGVIIHDGRNVLWANDAYCKIVGFTMDEVLAPTYVLSDRLPPEEQVADDARHAERLAAGGGAVQRFDVSVLRKDRSRITCDVSVKLFEVDGRPLRLAILRDISARKASERALADQRDLYEALVHATSELGQGFVLTKDNAVVFANEAAAGIFGTTIHDLAAARKDPLSYFVEGEIERLRHDPDARSRGPGEGRHFTAKMRRKDGTVFDAEIASTSVIIRNEAYRLALIRDITPLKRSQEDLEIARRQLAVTEKFAALGSLVSGVAHEIRTPLTIIRSNLHLLGLRAAAADRSGNMEPLAKVAPQVMTDVDAAIERAEGLVKSLRRLTRPEASATRQAIDAPVREAIELFESVNRGRARVEARLEATTEIIVDRPQLQQVVLNLLDNAAHASAGKTDPVVVRTFATPNDAEVVLVIEDRGIGMTREVEASMYEPLFTTRAEGTGLGLAIVRSIVAAHRGRIECETRPGEGTRFTITFPAAKLPQA